MPLCFVAPPEVLFLLLKNMDELRLPSSFPALIFNSRYKAAITLDPAVTEQVTNYAMEK